MSRGTWDDPSLPAQLVFIEIYEWFKTNSIWKNPFCDISVAFPYSIIFFLPLPPRPRSRIGFTPRCPRARPSGCLPRARQCKTEPSWCVGRLNRSASSSSCSTTSVRASSTKLRWSTSPSIWTLRRPTSSIRFALSPMSLFMHRGGNMICLLQPTSLPPLFVDLRKFQVANLLFHMGQLPTCLYDFRGVYGISSVTNLH